jgi:hypothetical protein
VCVWIYQHARIAKPPDIDPLENDLSESVVSSQESMNPAPESRKYFTAVVHHSAEVDPINIFKNGATAITSLDCRCLQKLENPDIDPLENDLSKSVRSSQESTTPALESRKYFTVVAHHSASVDPINIFKNEATAIEFSGVNGSKRLHHWVRAIPL